MERERRLVTCAHHGCYGQENNLEAARLVLKQNREIGLMEIDFVEYGGQFVSSHDHTPHSCANGSTLAQWVEFLCVRKRRLLYMDLKAQYGLWSWWQPQHKFNLAALLQELNRLREYYMSSRRKHPVDITRLIWIASQDPDVAQQLLLHCHGTPWIPIADIPYMSAYVKRAVTPSCMWPAVNQTVLGEMLHTQYPLQIAAIDCSFLAGTSFEKFVRDAGIQPGATLIPYAFERTQRPIELEGYTVIMVYNYRASL